MDWVERLRKAVTNMYSPHENKPEVSKVPVQSTSTAQVKANVSKPKVAKPKTARPKPVYKPETGLLDDYSPMDLAQLHRLFTAYMQRNNSIHGLIALWDTHVKWSRINGLPSYTLEQIMGYNGGGYVAGSQG